MAFGDRRLKQWATAAVTPSLSKSTSRYAAWAPRSELFDRLWRSRVVRDRTVGGAPGFEPTTCSRTNEGRMPGRRETAVKLHSRHCDSIKAHGLLSETHADLGL